MIADFFCIFKRVNEETLYNRKTKKCSFPNKRKKEVWDVWLRKNINLNIF